MRPSQPFHEKLTNVDFSWKQQLDRNLQDNQDDAIYRRCEFIRTQSPEPACRQANSRI
jgi:hypothetical protein